MVDILLGAILGMTLTANVIASQHLFDAITDAAMGRAGFLDCLVPLLGLAAAMLGVEIVQGVFDFQADVIFKKSAGKLKMALYQKLQKIDPAQYENPAFWDDLNKAREGAAVIPYFCMSLFIMVSFYLVYFISVGVYLFLLKPLLLMTLLLSFLPTMLGQILRVRVFTKVEQQSAPLRREVDAYQKALCDRECFKETRTLGAFRFFATLFDESLKAFTKKQWSAERKTALLQLALNLSTFAGMGISSILLVNAILANEITIGAFAAVFAALRAVFSMMQQIVMGHLGNINQNLGKVNNFICLMDMPARGGAQGVSDFSQGVVVENASFTYWGRKIPAVKDVSLSIGGQETIGIVGENGAGKSTLVRLLTGIYRPSQGKVMVGGLDTATFAPDSVYRGISGVFQKVQRYKMTLEENVTLSDPKGMGQNTDIARIQKALDEAGVEQHLPLTAMLSPEYGGIDLSGGQWQRLAIARGLYRINGIIVLDEPTAAIDPLEETRVYRSFQQLAKGKCAIVVTHRLGSAKLAHRIVVMDAGKIADIGTHEELMARPGKYVELYAAQAQWYMRSPGS
jgi:ATP-binding cassette subfamily B protein